MCACACRLSHRSDGSRAHFRFSGRPTRGPWLPEKRRPAARQRRRSRRPGDPDLAPNRRSGRPQNACTRVPHFSRRRCGEHVMGSPRDARAVPNGPRGRSASCDVGHHRDAVRTPQNLASKSGRGANICDRRTAPRSRQRAWSARKSARSQRAFGWLWAHPRHPNGTISRAPGTLSGSDPRRKQGRWRC